MIGQKSMYYILDANGDPVPARDLMEMADWKQKNFDRCVVAKTTVGTEVVSTVFLCINHALGNDRPVLFETMVFDDSGAGGDDTLRYHTRDEAIEGHNRVVEELKRGGCLH